jgi:outer membrane receptor protein involved in Fe transport
MDMRMLSSPTMTPISATAPIPFCRFNFNSYFMLVLEEERVNTYATVEHDLSDHTMVFFEGGYARMRTHRILSPSFAILQPIFVPADHMYNPTGSRLRVYGRLLGGNSPPMDQYYDSDTLHTVAGIGGDFGGFTDSKFGEWEWELAGTWSMNRFTNTLPDNIIGPLQDALNQCGPTGDPARCLNPFFFGAPNSKTVIDRVTSDLDAVGNVELTTAGVDLTGPIVELPGGDLSLALGAQMRHETAWAELDYNSNQLQYAFLVGGPDWQAERQIFAGYGELALPFFEGFEMQAAGRLENYDDVGSSVTPMAGISWTPAKTFMGDQAPPVSMVRVRGTYANSFRAPSLLQTNGAQTALVRLFDTGPNPMDPTMPLQPTSATFRPVRTLGNPDLEPQTSTAITAGVEWTPAQGLLIQGDYWNYNYEEIIVKEEPQPLIDADFMARNPMNPLGNPRIRRDANSRVIEQVDTEFINATSVKTHGIDAELGYRSDFGAKAGTFSFGATASYVLSYEIPIEQFPATQRVAPGAMGARWEGCSGDTCDVAGLRNLNNFARPIPKLRVTVPLSWNLDMHTVAVIGNFIGGYNDDETLVMFQFPDIDPFFTVDLQYALRIDEGDGMATTIKVGVLNIADSKPPYIDVPLGYDSQTHDPRGRMIYGRLVQEL